MYNKEDVIEHLKGIIDTSSGISLGETGGVKFVDIDKEKDIVNMVIALTIDEDKYKREMTRSLAKLIKLDLGFTGIKIDFELLKKAGSILARQVTYIGVASGKGGVGKSTVTANLAYALKSLGKTVGIIDADIYGSSIPTIIDIPITKPRATKDEKIIPFEKDGIQLISTEFFVDPNKPLMWRGPMLGKMLNHFFYDVKWSEDIDFVLVDLPPGTGDVALDIQTLIPQSKMIIVTTPHLSASHIAVKAGFAAKELGHEILGVVENMSYFENDGEKFNIFGQGGGKVVADKLETQILTSIPIGQPTSGHHSIFGLTEDIGIIYLGLANKIIKEI